MNIGGAELYSCPLQHATFGERSPPLPPWDRQLYFCPSRSLWLSACRSVSLSLLLFPNKRIKPKEISICNSHLSRCLLNKKAEPINKILREVFELIRTFARQLSSNSWVPSAPPGGRAGGSGGVPPPPVPPGGKAGGGGHPSHAAFPQLRATYESFHQCTAFLFKGAGKLELFM